MSSDPANPPSDTTPASGPQSSADAPEAAPPGGAPPRRRQLRLPSWLRIFRPTEKQPAGRDLLSVLLGWILPAMVLVLLVASIIEAWSRRS